MFASSPDHSEFALTYIRSVRVSRLQTNASMAVLVKLRDAVAGYAYHDASGRRLLVDSCRVSYNMPPERRHWRILLWFHAGIAYHT